MKRFKHYQCTTEPCNLDRTLLTTEKDGWELVSVIRYLLDKKTRYRLFFKREIDTT